MIYKTINKPITCTHILQTLLTHVDPVHAWLLQQNVAISMMKKPSNLSVVLFGNEVMFW